MLQQQAWTANGLAHRGAGHTQLARYRTKRARVNHSWPQQARRRHRDIQNSRFNAHLRLASIHDERNLGTEAFANVLSLGWRKLAGPVRTGDGQRKITLTNNRLNEGMTR